MYLKVINILASIVRSFDFFQEKLDFEKLAQIYKNAIRPNKTYIY